MIERLTTGELSVALNGLMELTRQIALTYKYLQPDNDWDEVDEAVMRWKNDYQFLLRLWVLDLLRDLYPALQEVYEIPTMTSR